MLDECLVELKKTSKANTHVLSGSSNHCSSHWTCNRLHSFQLSQEITTSITVIVLSFIAMLQAKVQGNARPHSVETQTSRARLLWIQDVQAGLSDEPKFLIWKDDIYLVGLLVPG